MYELPIRVVVSLLIFRLSPILIILPVTIDLRRTSETNRRACCYKYENWITVVVVPDRCSAASQSVRQADCESVPLLLPYFHWCLSVGRQRA